MKEIILLALCLCVLCGSIVRAAKTHRDLRRDAFNRELADSSRATSESNDPNESMVMRLGRGEWRFEPTFRYTVLVMRDLLSLGYSVSYLTRQPVRPHVAFRDSPIKRESG